VLLSLWIFSKQQPTGKFWHVFCFYSVYDFLGLGIWLHWKAGKWWVSLGHGEHQQWGWIWAPRLWALRGSERAFSISAHVAAHLSVPLLLLLPLLWRLCRYYIFVCCLLAVQSSSWGGISALDGKRSIDALHSWLGQLCLFPAVETTGSVKENVFKRRRGAVERWITNQKSWQCHWLGLRGTDCGLRATWLSLQRRGMMKCSPEANSD